MQFSQTIERKPGSLIQSQSEFSKRDEGPISSPKETGRKQFSDFHFGNIPILAGDKIIQPKLTINQPCDQYEREADAMADKVMRMTQPEPQTASTIQRKCAKCEAEEKKKKLQRKENNPNSPTVSTGLENYTNSLDSRGQPLSKETRSFFEPRFGYDFGHVRIHNDGMAAQSAQSIQARAYTLGSHIVFNRGEFRPHTEDGKRLLGHELTHVVQQGSGIKRREHESNNQLKTHIKLNNWKESFEYLNGLEMKIILENLKDLKINEIDNLITNADTAQKAHGNTLKETEKNRCLAGIWTIKCIKQKSLTVEQTEKVGKLIMRLNIDERKVIYSKLKQTNNKNLSGLISLIGRPLAGYHASGYDFSDRFFKHDNILGFETVPENKTLPTEKWSSTDPDPQTDKTTQTATKAFEKSDILFFSGHQYAQYRRPGLFTNDDSSITFDISKITKRINRAKLIVSTSCATICRDVATIFSAKFPNAVILGYKYSAPQNGSRVSSDFSSNLATKGPIDLSSKTDMEGVKEVWRKITTTPGNKKRQPGILDGNEVEYYDGEWKKSKLDDKVNECKYHED